MPELQLPRLKFHHSRVFIAAQIRPQGVRLLHQFNSNQKNNAKKNNPRAMEPCKHGGLINDEDAALRIITVTSNHTPLRGGEYLGAARLQALDESIPPLGEAVQSCL